MTASIGHLPEPERHLHAVSDSEPLAAAEAHPEPSPEPEPIPQTTTASEPESRGRLEAVPGPGPEPSVAPAPDVVGRGRPDTGHHSEPNPRPQAEPEPGAPPRIAALPEPAAQQGPLAQPASESHLHAVAAEPQLNAVPEGPQATAETAQSTATSPQPDRHTHTISAEPKLSAVTDRLQAIREAAHSADSQPVSPPQPDRHPRDLPEPQLKARAERPQAKPIRRPWLRALPEYEPSYAPGEVPPRWSSLRPASGPQLTLVAPPQEPTITPQALWRLLMRILEVLEGRRNVGQLHTFLSADAYEALLTRLRMTTPGRVHRLRRVRTCYPSATSAEVAAVIDIAAAPGENGRVCAMATRLERAADSWRCTVLRLL